MHFTGSRQKGLFQRSRREIYEVGYFVVESAPSFEHAPRSDVSSESDCQRLCTGWVGLFLNLYVLLGLLFWHDGSHAIARVALVHGV